MTTELTPASATTEPSGDTAPATRDGIRPRGGRFPCFDGLRAIAALAVLVYHVCVTYSANWISTDSWSWITRFGNFGVSIFFLISGFLLYRPYVVSHFDGKPPPALGPFWKRRFLRIFPAYWVALTALFFFFIANPIDSRLSFITYYGLIQNYRAGYTLRGLGIAWTLVIEVSFYIALPLLAFLVRSLSPNGSLRRKLVAQLWGLAFLYALAVVVRVWHLWFLDIPKYTAGDWFPRTQIAFWLIGYLDWFALGMALAVASAWAAKGGRLPRILVALGNYPAVSWFLALELFWVTLQLNIPANQGAFLTEWQYLGISFFYGFVALLLLVPAVFGPQDEGVIRGFLRSRVMVALGVISYGVYLWHIIWVKQVQRWTIAGDLPKNLWVWFAVTIVLTIATATASWFLLERPIIRWSHRPRLFPRPKPRPPAPDPASANAR